MKKKCVYTWNGKEYSEESFKEMYNAGLLDPANRNVVLNQKTKETRGFYNRMITSGLEGFEALFDVSYPQFNEELVSRPNMDMKEVMDRARQVMVSIVGEKTKKLFDALKNADKVSETAPDTISLMNMVVDAYSEMYDIYTAFEDAVKKQALNKLNNSYDEKIKKAATDDDRAKINNDRDNAIKELEKLFENGGALKYIETNNQALVVEVNGVKLNTTDTDMVALMPELYRLMGSMSEMLHNGILSLANEKGIEGLDPYSLAQMTNRILGAYNRPKKLSFILKSVPRQQDNAITKLFSAHPELIPLIHRAIEHSQSLASMSLFFNKMQMQIASRAGSTLKLVSMIYDTSKRSWGAYMQMQQILAERFGYKKQRYDKAKQIVNAITSKMADVETMLKNIAASLMQPTSKAQKNPAKEVQNIKKDKMKLKERQKLYMLVVNPAIAEMMKKDPVNKQAYDRIFQVIKEAFNESNRKNAEDFFVIIARKLNEIGIATTATTMIDLVKDIQANIGNVSLNQTVPNIADPTLKTPAIKRHELIDEYMFQLSKVTNVTQEATEYWGQESSRRVLDAYQAYLSTIMTPEEVNEAMSAIRTHIAEVSAERHATFKDAVTMAAKAIESASAKMLDNLMKDIDGDDTKVILDPANEQADNERFAQFKKMLIQKGREMLEKIDAKEREELGVTKRKTTIDNIEVLAYLMRNQDALRAAFNQIPNVFDSGKINEYTAKFERLAAFVVDSEINKILNQIIAETKKKDPDFNPNNEAFTRENLIEWSEIVYNRLRAKNISDERAKLAVFFFQSAYEAKMAAIAESPIQKAFTGILNTFNGTNKTTSTKVDILNTLIQFIGSETTALLKVENKDKPTTLDYIKTMIGNQVAAQEIYKTVFKKVEEMYSKMDPDTPEYKFYNEMKTRSVSQRVFYIKNALLAKYFKEKLNELKLKMDNEAFTDKNYTEFIESIRKDIQESGFDQKSIDAFITRIGNFYQDEKANVHTNTANVISAGIIDRMSSNQVTPNPTVKSALKSALQSAIVQVLGKYNIPVEQAKPDLMYRLSLILKSKDGWATLRDEIFANPDLIAQLDANGIPVNEFVERFNKEFDPMTQMVSDSTMRRIMRELLESYDARIRDAAAMDDTAKLIAELETKVSDMLVANGELNNTQIKMVISQVRSFVEKDAVHVKENAANKIADKVAEAIAITENKDIKSIFNEMVQAVTAQFPKMGITAKKLTTPFQKLQDQIDKTSRLLANNRSSMKLFVDAKSESLKRLNDLLTGGKISQEAYDNARNAIEMVSPNIIIGKNDIRNIVINSLKVIPGFYTATGAISWSNIMNEVAKRGVESVVGDILNKPTQNNKSVRELMIASLVNAGLSNEDANTYFNEVASLIENEFKQNIASIQNKELKSNEDATKMAAAVILSTSSKMLNDIMSDIDSTGKTPDPTPIDDTRFDVFKNMLIQKGREMLNEIDAKTREELGVVKTKAEISNIEVLAYLMRNQDALREAYNKILSENQGTEFSNEYFEKLKKLSEFVLKKEINKVLNDAINEAKKIDPLFNINNEAFENKQIEKWANDVYTELVKRGVGEQEARLAEALFRSAYSERMQALLDSPIQKATKSVENTLSKAKPSERKIDFLNVITSFVLSESSALIKKDPAAQVSVLDLIKAMVSNQKKAREIYNDMLDAINEIYKDAPADSVEGKMLKEMNDRFEEQRVFYVKKTLLVRYFKDKLNELKLSMDNEAFTGDNLNAIIDSIKSDLSGMGMDEEVSDFIERVKLLYQEETKNTHTNTANMVAKRVVSGIESIGGNNKTTKTALSGVLSSTVMQIVKQLNPGLTEKELKDNGIIYNLSLILRSKDGLDKLKDELISNPDFLEKLKEAGIEVSEFLSNYREQFNQFNKILSDSAMRRVMRELLETYDYEIRELIVTDDISGLWMKLSIAAREALLRENPDITDAQINEFVRTIPAFIRSDVSLQTGKTSDRISDQILEKKPDEQIESLYSQFVRAVKSQFRPEKTNKTSDRTPVEQLEKQIDDAVLTMTKSVASDIFQETRQKALSKLDALFADGKISEEEYNEKKKFIEDINPTVIVDKNTIRKLLFSAFRSIPGFYTPNGAIAWSEILKSAGVATMYSLTSRTARIDMSAGIDYQSIANKVFNLATVNGRTVKEMIVESLENAGVMDEIEQKAYLDAMMDLINKEVDTAIQQYQRERVSTIKISDVNPSKDLLYKVYSMLYGGKPMEEILDLIVDSMYGGDALVYTPEQRAAILKIADLIQDQKAALKNAINWFRQEYAKIAKDESITEEQRQEQIQKLRDELAERETGASGYSIEMLMQEHALMLIEPSPLLNHQLFAKSVYTAMLSSIETFMLNVIEFLNSTASTVIADMVRVHNLDYIKRRGEQAMNAWRTGIAIAFNGYNPMFDVESVDKDIAISTPIYEVFKSYKDNPKYKQSNGKSQKMIAASWYVGKYFSRFIMAVNIINSYMQQDYAWMKMQHEKYKNGDITEAQWKAYLKPTSQMRALLAAKAESELDSVDIARLAAGKKRLSPESRKRFVKIRVEEMLRENNVMEDLALKSMKTQDVAESQFYIDNPDVQNAVMQMTRKMLSFQTEPTVTMFLGIPFIPVKGSVLFSVAKLMQSFVQTSQRPEALLGALYGKERKLSEIEKFVFNAMYHLNVTFGTLGAFAKTIFGVIELAYQSTLPVITNMIARGVMKMMNYEKDVSKFDKFGGGYMTQYMLAAYGNSKVISDYYKMKLEKPGSDLHELRKQNVEVMAHMNYLEIAQANFIYGSAVFAIIVAANLAFIDDDDDELYAIKNYLVTFGWFNSMDDPALNRMAKIIVTFSSGLGTEEARLGFRNRENKRPSGTIRVGDGYFNADYLGSSIAYAAKTFGLANDYMRAASKKIYENIYQKVHSTDTEVTSYRNMEDNLWLKMLVTGLVVNPLSLTPFRSLGSSIGRITAHPEEAGNIAMVGAANTIISGTVNGYIPSTGFIRSAIQIFDNDMRVRPQMVESSDAFRYLAGVAGLNLFLPKSYDLIGKEIPKSDIYPRKTPFIDFMGQKLSAVGRHMGISETDTSVNPETARFFNKYANTVKPTSFMNVKIETEGEGGLITDERRADEFEISMLQMIRGKALKQFMNGMPMHAGSMYISKNPLDNNVLDGGNEIVLPVIERNPVAAQKLLQTALSEADRRALYVARTILGKRVTGADSQIDEIPEKGYGKVAFYEVDGILQFDAFESPNGYLVDEIMREPELKQLIHTVYKRQKKRESAILGDAK